MAFILNIMKATNPIYIKSIEYLLICMVIHWVLIIILATYMGASAFLETLIIHLRVFLGYSLYLLIRALILKELKDGSKT